MKPELEKYLWDHTPYADQLGNATICYDFARNIIEDMVKLGMINSTKQGYATLEKWVKKGLWNYGSSIGVGWKVRKEEKC